MFQSFKGVVLALVTALVVGSAPALAQVPAYPNKPVRLIVPFPAGGITDIVARTVAHSMSKHLGQQVFVENRAGAAGMIGHEAVARAVPDGYTILFATSGSMTINIQMVEKPRYDPVKDFTPIGQVLRSDVVLATNNAFPARNFPELIDIVKKNPGKYSFASGGDGTGPHLTFELLKQTAGLDVMHVPYKGDLAALNDVIAGNVPMLVASYGSISAQLKGGLARPIVLFGNSRLPAAPHLGTVAEQGYPTVVAATWGGIVGPAGLPPAVVARLSNAVHGAMNDPDVKAKYIEIGSIAVNSGPAEFAAFINEEAVKWGTLIKRLGLRRSE